MDEGSSEHIFIYHDFDKNRSSEIIFLNNTMKIDTNIPMRNRSAPDYIVLSGINDMVTPFGDAMIHPDISVFKLESCG